MNEAEPINKNSYHVEDKYITDDCNVYIMYFNDGNYLFKFALAGRCSTLTSKKYLEEYRFFLKKYLDDSKPVKFGLILVEYESINSMPLSLHEEILDITKILYNEKAEIRLLENDNKHLIINIKPLALRNNL